MSDNIMELHNVSFSYSEGKYILRDISLDIGRNDIIVLKGDSGAGKSTFLKLLNRFCDPSRGRIFFNTRELTEYSIEEIRSTIIYLPQVPHMIDGSVEENLAFPFSFHSHRNKQFDPSKAEEWLHYFQMNVPLRHNALRLSIGQKQRVSLIRSLMLDPVMLLLDEPASSLDMTNKKLIEQKIEHLTDSSRVTVIMATHSEISFSGSNYRTFHLAEGRLT